MSGKARYLIWILMAIVLLIGCTPAAEQQINQPTPSAVALDLPLQALDGSSHNLGDYAGQVIVVNFWATWCAPCRTEMPLLEAYYQTHHTAGVTLLAINAGEAADRARPFIEEGGYTFPVFLDLDEAAADYFGGVRGMPTTIVIDRSGQIAFQHVGELTPDILEEQVTPLIQ